VSRASDPDGDLVLILAAFDRTRRYFHVAQSGPRVVSGAGSAPLRMRYARTMRTPLAALLSLLSCGAGEPSAPTAPAPGEAELQGVQLHLSFDDAPWAGREGSSLPSAAEVTRLNARIVETLKSRAVPGSVFFNCDGFQEGDGSLEAWVEAGMEVGNHTFSHPSLNHEPLETWLADTKRCHEVLVGRLPSPPRYFRYPYLHRGPVLETRDGARRGLEEMGYTNAPISVATTEWRLGFAYKDAVIAGDAAQQQAVVDAHRKHMQEAVDASREMAREQVDREVAQIVLLHVNELTADHLGGVIDDYRARGATFVSLEQALADPVYAMEDQYVGSAGLTWLLRIRSGPPPNALYWFGKEEERLRELFPNP